MYVLGEVPLQVIFDWEGATEGLRNAALIINIILISKAKIK